MTYVKGFVIELEGLWVMIYWDVEFFFEISAHPHIMIAHKEMNRDSAICYLGQFS